MSNGPVTGDRFLTSRTCVGVLVRHGLEFRLGHVLGFRVENGLKFDLEYGVGFG